MTITKKLLITGALLLGIQPSTHAFTGDAYGNVFVDALKAVAAMGVIVGAVGATALFNYDTKLLNEATTTIDTAPASNKNFDPEKVIQIAGIGLGGWIAAVVTSELSIYTFNKIKDYYHKTQINNFANQILRQKDNKEALFRLAAWLKHNASNEYCRNVIIQIINNKKTTLENKIDLLLKYFF